jgi:hypothetical protein
MEAWNPQHDQLAPLRSAGPAPGRVPGGLGLPHEGMPFHAGGQDPALVPGTMSIPGIPVAEYASCTSPPPM